MEIQKQPNKWSCLPTSFAMALNIPVKKLISELGHDGSEIIWPDLEDPYCRRAFHPQEFVGYCYKRHIHVIEIQAIPTMLPPGSRVLARQLYSQDEAQNRMKFFMQRKGVLTGLAGDKSHAVAWDGKRVYDPNGTIYTQDKFTICSFWLVT